MYLIKSGWFPFVQLVGDQLDHLISTNLEELEITEERILKTFSKEKLTQITDNWWRNSIFNSKKKILMAGINSFIIGDQDNIINCIKNLASEIEGIIRIDYHNSFSKEPTTKELKEYITSQGLKKFSSAGSLGFPGLFFEYLDKSIFEKFNVTAGEIPISRHSLSHGVTPESLFTKTRALQFILTLDQIYFYLGSDRRV